LVKHPTSITCEYKVTHQDITPLLSDTNTYWSQLVSNAILTLQMIDVVPNTLATGISATGMLRYNWQLSAYWCNVRPWDATMVLK